MKQFITNKEWSQFHKNNSKAYDKLVNWIRRKRKEGISEAYKTGCTYNEPPNYWEWFHVGRMIEFLEENKKHEGWSDDWLNDIYLGQATGTVERDYKGELCDTLWMVVKKILNNKNETT